MKGCARAMLIAGIGLASAGLCGISLAEDSGQATSTATNVSQRAILILDASGSMWGQLNGKSKIEIARETVAQVTAQWPEDADLGLVTYGHRQKGDCQDIETLIQPGPLQRDQFLAQVNGLNPKGKTPLSASVRQAAEALKYSEEKATVILVSDGEETCNLDPCAVGQELEQLGVDFTAHVVGFDIGKPEHQAQLRCLAENTGGRYFNARDAQELGTALNAALGAAVKPPPPPASAELKAAPSTGVASRLEITWDGPADDGDYIAVSEMAMADQEYVNYTSLLVKGKPVQLQMPSTAGTYELRYISPLRSPAVLARLSVMVVEAEAALDAPGEATAGGVLEFTARGPAGEYDWIGFAAVGSPSSAYLNGHYLRPNSTEFTAQLAVPGTTGDYELRYVLNEGARILVAVPIKVVEAQTFVQGPEQVMAGDLVEIHARGPAGDRHWIGFAPAGSEPGAYLANSYERPQGEESRITVQAPRDPGAYELRYILNESETIAASRPIQVVAATASLQVAPQLMRYSEVEIGFTGPRGGSHWIGFVPRGGAIDAYTSWSYVPQSSPLKMYTPNEEGAFDLVYVFVGAESGDRELARVPVELVTALDEVPPQ